MAMPSDFILAFHKLKEIAGDDPTSLSKRALAEPQLQEACAALRHAIFELDLAETYAPIRFADHIPSAEIKARREYELRWSSEVARTDELLRWLTIPEGVQSSEPRDVLNDAAESAAHTHRCLFELIEYARENVERVEEDNGDWDDAQDALKAWTDLIVRAGFRPGAVLARLDLVPFVLIPSNISKQHGSEENISLHARLNGAQRAFIFGCDLACAALQRAILEDVLERNYGTSGSLREKIKRAPLPWGLTPGELHSIADLGNEVLHPDRNRHLEARELMKRLINGLKALRKLIEGAPTAKG